MKLLSSRSTLLAACALASAAFALNVSASTNAGADQHLRVIRTSEPVFPASLALSPISAGEARIVINVDADGKLADWMVVSFTHQVFADTAVEALRSWDYEPARVNGQPVGVRVEVDFAFEARGKVVTITPIDIMEAYFDHLSPVQRQICRARDIDAPLQAVRTVSPGYNRAEVNPHSGGNAVLVDFYVDEEGRPRMPVVLESGNEHLASAAVGALSEWRFAPPTRNGRPVAVRAQQRFVFRGQK